MSTVIYICQGDRSEKLDESLQYRDFPGSPVVKTSPFNAGRVGSVPDGGTKIPHASWPKKKKQNQKHKTEAVF